jgi:hypothetical protein
LVRSFLLWLQLWLRFHGNFFDRRRNFVRQRSAFGRFTASSAISASAPPPPPLATLAIAFTFLFALILRFLGLAERSFELLFLFVVDIGLGFDRLRCRDDALGPRP